MIFYGEKRCMVLDQRTPRAWTRKYRCFGASIRKVAIFCEAAPVNCDDGEIVLEFQPLNRRRSGARVGGAGYQQVECVIRSLARIR